MKKLYGIVLALGLVFSFQNAFAYDWTYNGDTSTTSPEYSAGLIVGLGNSGGSQTATTSQQIQISGGGTKLGSGYSGYRVSFDANLSTYDMYKYNALFDNYLDVFGIVLSDQGYYWNLSNTNIHPLENNPALIMGDDPDSPGTTDSYWGGQTYGGLENAVASVSLDFTTDPAKEYYLSLFLQTRIFTDHPSWGTFSNVKITPLAATPEPASMILLGIGLAGVAISKRKRSHK